MLVPPAAGFAPPLPAAGSAPPPAAPSGKMLDINELGPNTWITMPDGGGVGSLRAQAPLAIPASRTATGRILNVKISDSLY